MSHLSRATVEGCLAIMALDPIAWAGFTRRLDLQEEQSRQETYTYVGCRWKKGCRGRIRTLAERCDTCGGHDDP